MEEAEQEDPRVRLARRKLKETEEQVAEEKEKAERWAKKREVKRREEQQKEEAEWKEATRERARAAISYAFETNGGYDKWENLGLPVLPLFEEVCREEIEKRLGKELPEDIILAIALALVASDFFE